MSGDLRLLNRQRTRPIDLRLLRKIVHHLLAGKLQLADFDLTIQFVNATKMARLNKTIMQHEGSTDVITLDYSDGEESSLLTGELFVCMDEALIQARQFQATWPAELMRYIIHGVLHLRGFDDQSAAERRRMKREETRLLGALAREFHLSKLRGKTRLTV
jgi:probable rRNA maturation factor